MGCYSKFPLHRCEDNTANRVGFGKPDCGTKLLSDLKIVYHLGQYLISMGALSERLSATEFGSWACPLLGDTDQMT